MEKEFKSTMPKLKLAIAEDVSRALSRSVRDVHLDIDTGLRKFGIFDCHENLSMTVRYRMTEDSFLAFRKLPPIVNITVYGWEYRKNGDNVDPTDTMPLLVSKFTALSTKTELIDGALFLVVEYLKVKDEAEPAVAA